MRDALRQHLVMVNEVADAGGGQTVLLQQADALASDGWTVTLVAPHGPVSELFTATGHRHVAYEFTQRRLMGWRRLPRPRALAARATESRRLHELVGRVEPTLVQSSSLCAHLAVGLWPRAQRQRSIWYLHQVHPPALFGLPLPSRIIAVSAASIAPARWRRSAVRRAVVVRNGVDTTAFAPDPVARERVRSELGVEGSRAVLVVVSRLAPDKRLEVLIDAAALLPDATVLIVGGSVGEEGAEYECGLRRRAVGTGDVRFLGHRGDVSALMNAADVVVQPSPLESFGLVLAEAAACGRTVVACDIPAAREIVHDGESGVLISCDAAPATWAKVLSDLINDPERLAAMGRAGRNLSLAALDLRRFAEEIRQEFARPR